MKREEASPQLLTSNSTRQPDHAYPPTNETKRFPGWIRPNLRSWELCNSCVLIGIGNPSNETLFIRKPSFPKTKQPSWQQAVQSSLTWDSRRLSHGLTWWGSTWCFHLMELPIPIRTQELQSSQDRRLGVNPTRKSLRFVRGCVRAVSMLGVIGSQ